MEEGAEKIIKKIFKNPVDDKVAVTDVRNLGLNRRISVGAKDAPQLTSMDLLDKNDNVLFNWIFNDFFSNILVVHGIKVFTLRFKDPDRNNRFNFFFDHGEGSFKSLLVTWKWIMYAALCGGTLVIAADFYNNNGDYGIFRDRVFIARVLGILVIFMPLVLYIRPGWSKSRFVSLSSVFSTALFISFALFFVAGNLFLVLDGLKLNVASSCMIIDVCLLINYMVQPQKPWFALLSGLVLFTIQYFGLWAAYWNSNPPLSFPFFGFSGVFFTNFVLIKAHYESACILRAIFAGQRDTKEAVSEWDLTKAKKIGPIQALIHKYVQMKFKDKSKEEEYQIFTNRIMNFSFEPILVLLLIHNFVRMPMTALQVSPSVMVNLTIYFFIPLVLLNIGFYIFISTFLRSPHSNASAPYILLNLTVHATAYAIAYYYNHATLGDTGKDLGMVSVSLFMILVTAISGLSLATSLSYVLLCLALISCNAFILATDYLSGGCWIAGACLLSTLVYITKLEQEYELRQYFSKLEWGVQASTEPRTGASSSKVPGVNNLKGSRILKTSTSVINNESASHIGASDKNAPIRQSVKLHQLNEDEHAAAAISDDGIGVNLSVAGKTKSIKKLAFEDQLEEEEDVPEDASIPGQSIDLDNNAEGKTSSPHGSVKEIAIIESGITQHEKVEDVSNNVAEVANNITKEEEEDAPAAESVEELQETPTSNGKAHEESN